MANDEKKVQLVLSAMDEFSATMNKFQRELKDMRGGLDEHSSAAVRNKRHVDDLGFSMNSLRAALPIAGLTMMAKQLLDTGIAMDRMRNSMQAATGSLAGLDFVRQEAQRLGLELVTASDGFIKLAAAARGTNMEGGRTKVLFTAVAEASTALGLSAEQTNGALMAVGQMMSKGTVQAEELRGQLGERIPGAFQIAARAMGVTTSELDDMLKKGKVVAEDFLPKFANQLQKEFPASEAATKSLGAEMNRLQTSMFELKSTVMNEGGGSSFFSTIAQDMSAGLGTLRLWVVELSKINKQGDSWETRAKWWAEWYKGQINAASWILTGKKPFGNETNSSAETAGTDLIYRVGDAPRGASPTRPAGKAPGGKTPADPLASYYSYLNEAASNNPPAPADISERLLNANGLLSEAQTIRFGQAVWRQRNAGALTELQIAQDEEYAAMVASEDYMFAYRSKARQTELQAETQAAAEKRQLWLDNATTYVSFAQQMSTMGVQMLFAEEGQKNAIGKRMLATSIRFIGQGLQAYMFGKAKEHVLNAAAAAGRTQTDMVAGVANLGILESQAVAWAAFFSAMSLNPYGGQAFIPAATAMAGVAGGVVPGAMASVSATGAASIASELGMAAAWSAGGIAVGALSEGGAGAIESGSVGGGGGGGYGGGIAGSPIITQPSSVFTPSSPSVTLNIRIYGGIHDTDSLGRDLIPSIQKALKDGVGGGSF